MSIPIKSESPPLCNLLPTKASRNTFPLHKPSPSNSSNSSLLLQSESFSKETQKIRQLTQNLSLNTTQQLKTHKKIVSVYQSQKLLTPKREVFTPVRDLSDKTDDLVFSFQCVIDSAAANEELYGQDDILLTLKRIQNDLKSLQERFQEQSMKSFEGRQEKMALEKRFQEQSMKSFESRPDKVALEEKEKSFNCTCVLF